MIETLISIAVIMLIGSGFITLTWIFFIAYSADTGAIRDIDDFRWYVRIGVILVVCYTISNIVIPF